MIDESGVEGRFIEGFSVDIAPEIFSAFPSVGCSAGGTRVVLTGEHFVPGAEVSIDGILQASVTVVSPTRLDVVTTGGVPGGPHVLRVSSPAAGFFAETEFTYVNFPDPVVSSVTPDEADTRGGARVSLLGEHLDSRVRVVFGADPRTGTGGVTGESIELVDEGLLRVTVPAASRGTTSILIENLTTGQATILEAGFTYTGERDLDDGGGCSAVPLQRPPTMRDVFGGAGWILLAFFAAFLRARRCPSAAA